MDAIIGPPLSRSSPLAVGSEAEELSARPTHNCWEVTERPIHVPELIATIYAKLGIDYRQMYQSNVGRPVRVIDEPFEAVKELLA